MPDKTPSCVIAFLGGTLPGSALLHIKQLNLFGMITRAPGSILHQHGTQILTSTKLSAHSWFQQVRDLCVMYSLPHPLELLEYPPSKASFNRSIKAHIVDFWEQKLRNEASKLTSLPYFKPHYMSLLKPHPIWTSCAGNAFQVHKATVTAKMLSGRYYTDRLQRFWTPNKDGYCTLPLCQGKKESGTLEHLLVLCPSLENTRQKLLNLLTRMTFEDSALLAIINEIFETNDSKVFMQLLLRDVQEYSPQKTENSTFCGENFQNTSKMTEKSVEETNLMEKRQLLLSNIFRVENSVLKINMKIIIDNN